MLPEWMKKSEEFNPENSGNAFIIKTIKMLGKVMSRIQVQKGHEKAHSLPALLKLVVTFLTILMLAITRNVLLVLTIIACILLYLCTWPARDIARIIKAAAAASVFTSLILLPAVIMDFSLFDNELFIVIKVFFCVLAISIFNHTTQWNHITGALRKLHIPGIFVFTIDITLKYIVLLGNLFFELLTSLQLRSVGKSNKKYSSVGGVMGVTFIRGVEMNRQMYEAMQCRGFTDDYKGM